MLLKVLCNFQNPRKLPVVCSQQVSELRHQGTAQGLFTELQRPAFQVCLGAFVVCVPVRAQTWCFVHRSGFSLGGGVFPICWKGLSSLLGCSTDLLNSCAQGPHAKSAPTCTRRGVLGIDTHPSLSGCEAPLVNKGDTVERCFGVVPEIKHPLHSVCVPHGTVRVLHVAGGCTV